MELVKNLNVINAMLKRSLSVSDYFIEIDKKHKYVINGEIVKPIYYKGYKYKTTYFDGCFYPYITRELIETIK